MSVTHVLIFGEGNDHYDSQAIEHLVRALAPAGVTLRFNKLRSPLILDKAAARSKRTNVAEEVAGHYDARIAACKVGERVIVVCFHDCDAVEPAHVEQSKALEAELRAAGISRAVAATPAWCIESWWMLFPEALAATRGCWKHFKTPGNVGSIPVAKTALRRALRPSGSHRCPDYDERDSPTIARHVLERKLASDATTSRSASLALFRDRLRTELA